MRGHMCARVVCMCVCARALALVRAYEITVGVCLHCMRKHDPVCCL